VRYIGEATHGISLSKPEHYSFYRTCISVLIYIQMSHKGTEILKEQFVEGEGNRVIKQYINFLASKYGQSHIYPIFFARFLITSKA
jgi:hypothetical protein